MILVLIGLLQGGLPYDPGPGPGALPMASGFGEITDTFHLPLDSSYALAGISFCSRDGRFYLLSIWDREVWSFDPSDPEATLRKEGFSLQDIFNDGFLDWHWGIAWADTSFFVSSAPATLDSGGLSEYSYSGEYLRSWKLDSVAGGWFPGLDYDYNHNLLWVVNVLGTDWAYAVSPEAPDTAVDSASQWVSSQRGISYFGYGHNTAPQDTITWLLVGGWNEDLLYKLDADSSGHPGIESAPMASMASLDVWEDTLATDSVFAFVTLSDESNTLYKVFLGITWEEWFYGINPGTREERAPGTGLVLGPNPSRGELTLRGLGEGRHTLRVYAGDGRAVLKRIFYGPGTRISIGQKGVYLVIVDGEKRTAIIR